MQHACGILLWLAMLAAGGERKLRRIGETRRERRVSSSRVDTLHCVPRAILAPLKKEKKDSFLFFFFLSLS